MIDHIWQFSDEASAKSALPRYLKNGSWRDEFVITSPVAVASGVRLGGFLLLVSLKEVATEFIGSANLIVVIDRKSMCIGLPGSILKSTLTVDQLKTLTISPIFAGANYAAITNPRISRYSKLVFSDDFESIDTIDRSATGADGFNWYPQHWFSSNITPPSQFKVENSVLELSGILQTAIVSKSSPSNYVGSVFGGGAYFEARIAFDPAKGALASAAWPAFWSMAIEHVYDSATAADVQWPGQANGYAHFIELDFFEVVHAPRESYQGKTGYYGTVHDWSGLYGANGWAYNIQNNGNKLFDVGAVDWSAFHVYGCLWVPSSQTSPGYAQWFFDGVPGPVVYWQGPVTSPPLPGQGSSFTPSNPAQAAATYAKIDSQRLAISLMTDQNWPMLVDWVRVWQEP